MDAYQGAAPAMAGSASDILRPAPIVLHGDCRALMAEMEEGSIDSIVTDPPYGLSREPNAVEVLTHWLAGDDYAHPGNGFMGNSWDSFVPGPLTWKQAYRVLKPGGYLIAFFGTRTYDLGTIAIRLAGFEVRDMVDWLYGSGFPKGGNRDGLGTCLKPAHEPIVVARKPLIGSARANQARFGTGMLNIDACRVCADAGDYDHAGDLTKRPMARRSFEAAERGSAKVVKAPPSSLGRWPANVIHDGSDEVLDAFPNAPGQQGDLRQQDHSVPAGVAFGQFGPKRAHGPRGDSGSAARFYYCAKASKSDRDEGLDAFDPQAFVQFQTGNGESGAASSLSEGRETQYRNIHPTVKPEGLMRYLVRLFTPPGGLVLDPFTGSGSTGKAAVLEGRRFIGCELTADYLPIARARIAAAVERAAVDGASTEPSPQPDLFEAEAA